VSFENVVRSEAISSVLAFSVMSRAAMLSGALRGDHFNPSRLVLRTKSRARDHAHEGFALELRHGLAHWRAADTEIQIQSP
jgi:hypothetical protein